MQVLRSPDVWKLPTQKLFNDVSEIAASAAK
jgi:hypothetical protein